MSYALLRPSSRSYSSQVDVPTRRITSILYYKGYAVGSVHERLALDSIDIKQVMSYNYQEAKEFQDRSHQPLGHLSEIFLFPHCSVAGQSLLKCLYRGLMTSEQKNNSRLLVNSNVKLSKVDLCYVLHT
ncbi:hypothetical protein EUTSA_v10009106mg [Eutrema salsugineum]|uniref:Uncharacterized protein n=1 Tax=Eutrema salsugineum TaxID=72664 RepID=V4L3G9_EUTSA|nr:uncharacterized protein LOC18992473 [Eutrema salsugineum]ESQ34293.1 hypothetical protein EUTSA_v10009106mg [Eutrema salsugineum]